MPEPAPLPRMTLPTLLVLRVLLDGETYALRICQATGLKSGTISPILARLADRGWLVQRWEDIDPAERGRPPRRYCRLTEEGARLAREAQGMAEVTMGLIPGRS